MTAPTAFLLPPPPLFRQIPTKQLSTGRPPTAHRTTIRSIHQINSPQHIPTALPHSPYPATTHETETDALETQFEQPPGGTPPPPPRDNNWYDDTSDSDLPPDLREALLHGSLTKSGLSRYKGYLRNPFLAFLLSFPPLRSRALADPAFLFKLAVQELVGNGTALAGEIAVRGKEIVHELEYVTSDLIVGTVVEAAFVWLLSPTLSTGHANGVLGKLLGRLPVHVFQPSGVLQYTVPLRVASFLYTGMQYAAVGMVAGVVGTAITYGLIEGRKALDRGYVPERPLPSVLPNSFGWAAFMALSSNPRFQAVEGLELLVRRVCPVGGVVNGGIVALRFVNNYWGGVQFVQFFRFLGLHATGESNEPETG